ncbi:DUF805 domain-containing protein [Candidatus Methylopumilus planktonicus]|uniref:DUF805 domain-containing protein n=1 Tax=Candidatus Methylopumilus planktonicus TaxID=1581557 RepID=UPI003BEED92D
MLKNLINNFFKDWVVFDGRLDRKSFLINFSINLISQIVFTLFLLNSVFGSSGITQVIFGFLALIIYGCLQINFYSLIVRRLHDNSKSGWWILLFFLSIVFSTGIRQSTSIEEQVIFSVLLLFSASFFLYLLFSSDKNKKTLKKNSVKNISLTKKPHLFKNYKIFVILIVIILTAILFVFVPYKTKYYQCKDYSGTRSLIINKYLPNNYSIIISNNKLKPYTIKKEWCQSNVDSVGFVCKFKIPIKYYTADEIGLTQEGVPSSKESFASRQHEDIDKLLDVRKRLHAAGDKNAVKELDEYIKTLPHKKYLYRFDPITNRLKAVITSSEEGELSNNIYSCEQTENNF